MTSSTVVGEARRALGPAGAFLPVPTTSAPPIDQQREAVRRLERAGYRAAWTNETVGGKDALVQLAVLLAATERMVFGTGIANIWARAPQTAHGASALLAQAYPGRFVLGLGVGHPQQAASVGREFGRPLDTMREYLDRMGAPAQLPAPDAAYPRIIGANGPKMLALAGEITDGALPAMQPPEFTAQGQAGTRPGQAPGHLHARDHRAGRRIGDHGQGARAPRRRRGPRAARPADRHRLRRRGGPSRAAGPGAGRAALISASGARTGPAGHLILDNSLLQAGARLAPSFSPEPAGLIRCSSGPDPGILRCLTQPAADLAGFGVSQVVEDGQGFLPGVPGCLRITRRGLDVAEPGQ